MLELICLYLAIGIGADLICIYSVWKHHQKRLGKYYPSWSFFDELSCVHGQGHILMTLLPFITPQIYQEMCASHNKEAEKKEKEMRALNKKLFKSLEDLLARLERDHGN